MPLLHNLLIKLFNFSTFCENKNKILSINLGILKGALYLYVNMDKGSPEISRFSDDTPICHWQLLTRNNCNQVFLGNKFKTPI